MSSIVRKIHILLIRERIEPWKEIVKKGNFALLAIAANLVILPSVAPLADELAPGREVDIGVLLGIALIMITFFSYAMLHVVKHYTRKEYLDSTGYFTLFAIGAVVLSFYVGVHGLGSRIIGSIFRIKKINIL